MRGATLQARRLINDGGNSDRNNAVDAGLRASRLPMFIQFMAIGRDNDFPFLQELDELTGREVDAATSHGRSAARQQQRNLGLHIGFRS